MTVDHVDAWTARIEARLQRASPRSKCLMEVLALLVAWDLLLPFRGIWAVQASLLAVTVALPGFLALRATRMTGIEMTLSPVWLVGAGLVVLTLTGALVDIVGHAVGIEQPLRVAPLTVGLNLVVVLLALAGTQAGPWTALRAARGRLDRGALLLVLPILTVAGAIRLNVTGTSQLAIGATAATTISLAWGFVAANRWPAQRLMWLLYAASAALMLGFSMRSDFIFGWDISAEFGLLRHTVDAGYWPTLHPDDAYGAMLSLTVLPSLLHAMTGLEPVVIFKLVYPVMFGLFPVAVFALVRSVVSTRVAFLGASVLLTLFSFQQEMPALARQEIALLLFVGLLAAVLDSALSRSTRLMLIAFLAVGMTVSHYSTTYAAVTLFAGAIATQFVFSFWHRAASIDIRKVLALGVTLTTAVIWYVGVTQSTSNVGSVVRGMVDSGLEILPNSRSGNVLERYLLGNLPKHVSAAQYQQGVTAIYIAKRPWVVRVAGAESPQWTLRDASPPSASHTSPSSVVPRHLLDLVVLLLAQLLNLLAVLGTLALLFSRRIRGVLFDFGVFALPALGLLAAVRLSSSLAGWYGPQRLLIQMLPILAVPMLVSLTGTARLERRLEREPSMRWLRRTSVVGLAGVMLALSGAVLVAVSASSGLLATLFGDRSSANLFSQGEVYERFNATTGDAAAAQWLAAHQTPGTLTYSDLYGALRLLAFGQPSRPLLTDLAPQTVDSNAWVFGTTANVVDGRARASFAGTTVVFAFPKDFLTQQFGVVYSNGQAEVFRR